MAAIHFGFAAALGCVAWLIVDPLTGLLTVVLVTGAFAFLRQAFRDD